jgi:uncharacterized membrane protein
VSLAVVWLHLLAMTLWIGGIAYQSHVLLPAARRTGELRSFAEAARRGRVTLWAAAVVVVLSGLYNVTRLGPLETVMRSGAGLTLAGKFIVVLLMISLAAHRDFGQVPRLAGPTGLQALRTIAWLDRAVLLLAVVVIYLGLTISRLIR